jgi:hypothetical protein
MVTRGDERNYRLMRYGVSSALVAGVFSHHESTDSTYTNSVFYDEYSADLGLPTAPPIELGMTQIGGADFEFGIPPSFSNQCGSGLGIWTQDPNLVIDGFGSLLGRPGGTDNWQLFLCTDPDDIDLLPGATYTVTFNYRVVSEPPGDGYFFVGARSNTNINGSDRNLLILDPPAGTVGHARGEVTLGNYPDYFLLWGFRNGGQIVIDSIRIMRGQGGYFRRNFEHGIALVNPTGAPVTVPLGGVFHRIPGVVDTLTNNGATVIQVTLAPQDGLVLLNGPATGVAENPAAPAEPPLFLAFPNPVPMSAAGAVQIAGVPDGGSVAIVSPLGRIIRIITEHGSDGGWRWDLKGHSARPAASGVYVAMIRDAGDRAVGALRLTLTR